ncbi:CBS domain-containing protein [Methanoregula sp.]|uniref:CBS domain-containing protein n=1 Tax=Methanoregula sp. TaxID=2052170 RepID=UPI00236AC1E4|nr:CBS domain-containing protein [Methanoregula sp.]MDD1687469.1 CBS domain-containing protein [Methanoregula sp.]
MDGSFRIGRLFGIPILIHYTFLLVIPLFAWIIGSQITLTIDMLREIYQVPIDVSIATAGYMPYVLGTIVAFGLFFGVLVHELAHSLVARAKGIAINSITLMIFGGIATMEEGVPDPKAELPMAIVGPIASLIFGLICSLLIYAVPSVTTDPGWAGVLIFILGYLGVLNIILCAFNLIPAFPMDGGRVLRAWLAKRMPLHQATKIAADIGKGFAIVFGIIGLFAFSPFLILIALFIYIGANMESSAVKYSHLLQDVSVGSMMSTPVTTVGSTMPVSQVIAMMYSSKHLGFPVIERDTLVGMITLADVNRTSPIDREAMQVRDIMTKDLITLPPTAPVIDALRIMSAKDIGRIPVVADGKIVGIVTRTDILKVTELRQV